MSNYQDLQGIGMTSKLALPTLIALCSIALNKPVLSSTAIMGEISISGTRIKVDELANALQVCLDSGAKKVLIPSTSFADFATIPVVLLCKEKDDALVEITLPEDANIYASEYQLYLPDKKELQKKLKEWIEEGVDL